MSQKNDKLLRREMKRADIIDKGYVTKMKVHVYDKKTGKVLEAFKDVYHSAEKQLKRAFKKLNWIDKTEVRQQLLLINKKTYAR